MKPGFYEGIYFMLGCGLLAKILVLIGPKRNHELSNEKNAADKNDFRRKRSKRKPTSLLIRLLKKLHINKIEREAYLFHFTTAVAFVSSSEGGQPLTQKDFVKMYTYSVLISGGFIPKIQREVYFDPDGAWKNESQNTWIRKCTGSLYVVVYQFNGDNGLLISWDVSGHATSTVLMNLNAIDVEIRNNERDIENMFHISTLLKSRKNVSNSSASSSISK
ncbi:uncharacterized protein LOC135849365 [Planococcus citri]|uniref:uncharacterized protein LOC135849365 n=1 Tax=Planococcus citri TaxID=170843 RepID=UPI0031F9883B